MLEGSCHCGAVRGRLTGDPGTVTACNCTICRRYGALWAYDGEGERITVTGATTAYVRGCRRMGFHFCPTCGCGAHWRLREVDAEGRRRIAVNVWLAEAVAALAINHFDGLVSFEDLPRDGRCLRDDWG